MPGPLELFTWVFPPGNSKRPVVVRDQEVRIYLRALQEDGTPGSPTGLRLEVRRPDGSIQVIDGGDIEAGDDPGTFYGAVQADQNRVWRYEWIHTGPVEGRMNGSFTVQSGTVQPPGDDSPVLATEDLDPLATQGGGLLRVKRITALPPATSSGGLHLVGVQDGSSARFPAEDLSGPTLVIDGGHGVKPGQGQPTGDQSQVIRDAAAELLSRYGHGRLLFRNCLKIDQTVILPPNVTAGFGVPPLADKDWQGGNGLLDSPALFFGASGRLQSMHSLQNICALPAGFVVPTGTATYPYSTDGMMAALDIQAAMLGRPAPFLIAGDGLHATDDLYFSDLSAFGFALVVESIGATRTRFRNIYGDSAGGIKQVDSGGNTSLERLVMRGFLSRAGGVRNITCPILATSNVGGKLTLTVAPAREPPSIRSWAPGEYVGEGKKVFWGTALYKTDNAGFFGATPPTHGPSPRKADNGGVELIYIGPWTSGNLAPATTIPVTTGGFLKPGHSVILNIPPRDCYTGNPAYPHWSTPGAPEDIATMGGDIVDPLMRGRMVVYSFGTTTADYWTVTLDCPYDAGLAAACANANLAIIPTTRFGSTFWSENSDGVNGRDILSKGPRFDLRIHGVSHKFEQGSSEDANASEEDVDDWGNISIALSKGGIRSKIGWAAKSKGTLLRIDTKKNNYCEAHMLLRGATYRAIHHVSGAATVFANFEGAPIVHSEPGARHLMLHFVGQTPVITSPDGMGQERVTVVGPTPIRGQKRAHAIMGAHGVVLGLGIEEEPWQPLTDYSRNRIVTNPVHAEEDALYLYRAVSEVDGTSGTGDGPQHTSGNAVEGTITWFCLGPYQGGQGLFEASRADGGVNIYGAEPDTGANRVRGLEVRQDRVTSLLPFGAPNIPTPITLSATTVGAVSQAMTLTGTAAVGTPSGYGMIGAENNGKSRLLRLLVAAHNTNTGAGDAGEAAGWVLSLLMVRGSNAASCSIARTDGGPITDIAPTTGSDTGLATARLTVAMVDADLVVTANASLITGGRAADWTARLIEELGVGWVPPPAPAPADPAMTFADGAAMTFVDGSPITFVA